MTEKISEAQGCHRCTVGCEIGFSEAKTVLEPKILAITFDKAITAFGKMAPNFKGTSIGFQKAMTLPVMIAGSLTVRGLEFWKVSSLSILAIIPPVILAVILSRYLVRGLTMGAVKG